MGYCWSGFVRDLFLSSLVGFGGTDDWNPIDT